MAEWVTHLIVADRVLEQIPMLLRKEFCVGNIAPDCNIPNEDGTNYIPPREVTHFMNGKRKSAGDCEVFLHEYVLGRAEQIKTREEMHFLLGYYSHLVTDAEIQTTIRDEKRVAEAWRRVKSIPEFREKAESMEVENWDNFKSLFHSRRDRLNDFYQIEREYLDAHPDSAYLTVIKDIKEFPDYLDFLPPNAIANKIATMYYMPEVVSREYPFLAFTKEEYMGFLDRAVEHVVSTIKRLANEGIIE